MDCSYLPAGVIKSNHGRTKTTAQIQTVGAGADTGGARLEGGEVGGEHPSRIRCHQTHNQGDILLDDKLDLFIYSGLS